MKNICNVIRKNPNTKIKVIVGKPDDLCIKCPHRYKDRCMQSEEIGKWVEIQDKKIANYLGIEPDLIYTAKEVFNLSINKINENTIESVCDNCVFSDNCIKVGINNSFRKDLNKN